MSDTKFKISVISPEKVLYSGEATHAVIPGSNGLFGVLAGHAPLVAELAIGVLRIDNGTEEIKMIVDGGFAQVKGNNVNVLANGGDLIKDLNPVKVQHMLEIAETLTGSNKEIEMKRAKARLALIN
jgi:F-type H+-transporting ATPase subunit epsilon